MKRSMNRTVFSVSRFLAARPMIPATLLLAATAAWAQLPGIGEDQRQCWSSVPSPGFAEPAIALSDLLTERMNGRCAPVATPGEWKAKRRRIQVSWSYLLGNGPSQPPALQARTLWEEARDGYRLRKLAYRVEADEEITSYLLIPERIEGRAPAIVSCMPTTKHGNAAMIGQAENEYWWYSIELARRGYIVLTQEVFSTGERITPGLQALDTTALYRKHPDWSMLGKMLWDHRRGVDYLESLDSVDRTRIGAIGFSLGAHNAALLAAYDERIAAAVSNAGIMHFAGSANPFAWARQAVEEGAGVSRFTYMAPLRKYLQAGETPTDWHELQALIAPRPYLDMNSVGDTWKSGLAAARQLRRLYRFLGAPDAFDYHVYDGGHSFPKPIRERAYAWLDRTLRPRTRR